MERIFFLATLIPLYLAGVAAVFSVPDMEYYWSLAHKRPEGVYRHRAVVNLDGGCSGFVARRNRIVTAAHCASANFATLYNSRIVRIQLLRKGSDIKQDDWAVFSANTSDIVPLPIATSLPVLGEECWIIGFGGASVRPLRTSCQVIDSGSSDDKGYIVLAATAIKGDSGGPVFNGNGEVVGILTRSSYPDFPLANAVEIKRVQIP